MGKERRGGEKEKWREEKRGVESEGKVMRGDEGYR